MESQKWLAKESYCLVKLIKRNVVHQLMHAIILEIKNLVNFLFAVPFSCKVNLSSFFFLRKQIKIYLHNLKNQTSNNKTVLQKKKREEN